MHRLLSSIAIPVVITLNIFQVSKAEVLDEKSIWKFSTQAHATYVIEATLVVDNQIVNVATIPVCHHARSIPCPIANKSAGDCRFRLNRLHGRCFRGVCMGKVKYGVWDAGGDPDSITLGIGLCNGKKILLNYLYDVGFNRDQSELIAPSFLILTKWLKINR